MGLAPLIHRDDLGRHALDLRIVPAGEGSKDHGDEQPDPDFPRQAKQDNGDQLGGASEVEERHAQPIGEPGKGFVNIASFRVGA